MTMKSTTVLSLFSPLLLFAASCDLGDGSDDDDSEQYASCQPLATSEVSIELGLILAVGRDSDGTIYMVDQPAGGGHEHRLFRSDGDVLLRREVTGSGQVTTPDGGDLYLFSFDEGDQVHTLVVDQPASG
jgi:hypothetical protein